LKKNAQDTERQISKALVNIAHGRFTEPLQPKPPNKAKALTAWRLLSWRFKQFLKA
jgi:hypothetical protein